MHTPADLFDEPGDARAQGRADTVSERDRLAALVGPGSPGRGRADRREDTSLLVAMVDDAVRTAAPVAGAGASTASPRGTRGHRRTDWLNVTFAAVAVAVVVVVAAFAGVQLANATPAASALRALTIDEASLANGERAVASGVGRIETLVAEVRAEADAAAPALEIVAGYTDEPARAAAVQGVADLGAALDAITLPALPEPYIRPAIDTEDLAAVGAQIDLVRERSDDVATVSEQVRALREQTSVAREAFIASLAALGATVPASADAEIAAHGEAETIFVDAVRDASRAVAAAQADGGLGIAELTSYPPAVDAMRLDHERAVAALIAEQEAAREAARNSGDRGGIVQPARPPVENPGAGDPGTEDPGTPEPGAGDPGTPEPGEGDPGTPEPGEGDPGTEEPGAGDPGTPEPGAGDPGAGDPGTEDPGTGETGAGDAPPAGGDVTP